MPVDSLKLIILTEKNIFSAVMENSESEVKIVVSTENDYEEKQEQSEKHLNIPKMDAGSGTPTNNNILLNRGKNERSRSLDPTNFLIEFERRQRRGSSISSLGNWTGAVIVSEAIDSSGNRPGKW